MNSRFSKLFSFLFSLLFLLLTLMVILTNISVIGPVWHSSTGNANPKLLIVSFDGFRWNYLTRTSTPHFDEIKKKGVHAGNGVMNVFTTSTLPNHWTMVTGLYPESHGIIDNVMYDPVFKKKFIPLYKNDTVINDERFYDAGAEPIWVTNQKQGGGRKSASIEWWGAENKVKGMQIDHHVPFKNGFNVTHFPERIDQMVDFFRGTETVSPVNLGLLYFNEPDHSAHAFGPDSERITELIAEADRLTGYLFQELKSNNIFSDMNIIITSDHGFAPVSRERLIFLDKIIQPDWYKIIDYSPVATIIPNDGMEDQVYNSLKEASSKNHFDVYRKSEIPERLHYRNNVRVTPIIAVAHLNYSFITQMPVEKFVSAGTHGYDTKYKDMRPFFMAIGPAFKEGHSVMTFDMVDLYPLMCHLLDIEPAPNNGSLAVLSELLKERPKQGNTAATYVLVVLFIICASSLVSILVKRLSVAVKSPNRAGFQLLPRTDEDKST